MRVPSTRQYGMPIHMTPMIDVVFQLIVFFTATSTIAKTEFSQDVKLPLAETGKEHDQTTQKREIVVNVSQEGVVSVAGRSVDSSSFREILVAELAQYSPAQIEVQFRADRTAPFGSVQPLLLECARSGVWQVGFAVKREQVITDESTK
jgi:biopolymer transport protein ExbD